MTAFMKKVRGPGEAVIAMEGWIRDCPKAVNVIVFNCFLNRLRSDPTLQSKWFQRMRDLKLIPNEITLSTVMSAAPTSEAAVLLIKAFIEDYPDAVQRHPNCFTALLSLLRNKRDFANMQHWWHEMCRRNIPPDGVTLTIMISAAPTSEAAILLMESFLEDFPAAVQRDPGCFTALLSRLRGNHDYVNMQHW